MYHSRPDDSDPLALSGILSTKYSSYRYWQSLREVSFISCNGVQKNFYLLKMQKVASLLAWAEGTSSSSLPVGTERLLIRIACFFAACMAENLRYHTVKMEVKLKIKVNEKQVLSLHSLGRWRQLQRLKLPCTESQNVITECKCFPELSSGIMRTPSLGTVEDACCGMSALPLFYICTW